MLHLAFQVSSDTTSSQLSFGIKLAKAMPIGTYVKLISEKLIYYKVMTTSDNVSYVRSRFLENLACIVKIRT